MSERTPLQQVIDELYELSANRDLFYNLLGRTPARRTPKAGATTTEETVKHADWLAQIRQGLEQLAVAKTKEDATKIVQTKLTDINRADPGFQTFVIGELVLFYTTSLASDTASAQAGREAALEELLRRMKKYGGRATREWMTVLIQFLHAAEPRNQAEDDAILALSEQRANLTGGPFTTRPGLIGEAFVGYGLEAERSGDTAKAKQCFRGVFLDLDYISSGASMPQNLRWELIAIYYWFEQACQGLLRLNPNDPGAKRKLKEVQALRQEKQFPDAPSLPQVGPIAQTYLESIPYLAGLLEELQHAHDDGTVFRVAHRHDYCRDIDFYQSAMGSYFSARPMLEGMGVHTMYDDAHQRVFDALDYAKRIGSIEE